MKIKLLVNWHRETCSHYVGDVIEVSKEVGDHLISIGQGEKSTGSVKEAAAVDPDTENASQPAPEKR
tara:strand:+ start:1447 stop:1647 length:201 start_codon:yes stop_codon:yes gene_type:complete